jgi:hypothetical protein
MIDADKKWKIKSLMLLKRQFNEFSYHILRTLPAHTSSSNHYFLWPTHCRNIIFMFSPRLMDDTHRSFDSSQIDKGLPTSKQ